MISLKKENKKIKKKQSAASLKVRRLKEKIAQDDYLERAIGSIADELTHLYSK